MLEMEVKTVESLQDLAEKMERFLVQKMVAPERVFDCRLVVNELIGNVFRHSQGVARLRVEIKNGFVELHVFSTVAYIPPKTSRCSGVDAEGGRGLYLVDSVCDERILADGGILVRIKMI